MKRPGVTPWLACSQRSSRTLARQIMWVVLALAFGNYAAAQSKCPRFPVGSVVQDPENLFSANGLLQVSFSYQSEVDGSGNTRFCFINSDGAESPTLHVRPGDTLILKLTNQLSAPSSASMLMAMPPGAEVCGAAEMDPSSVNLHYHGANISPTCGSDEVIHTLINSGQSFTYTVKFPANEPPGLYWYHPHVHGIAEAALQGGASGAIVVGGIAKLQPKVAGLRQRILIVRDYPLPADIVLPKYNAPAWDLSLNYIPVPYPKYTPAILKCKPREKQFWRVANASSDTILDIQLQYDGKPQVLQVVGFDGVPTGSQDGSRKGKIVRLSNILLPPAARAEFIITGPGKGVKKAILLTRRIDTGSQGETDPTRPLAKLEFGANEPGAAWAKRSDDGPATAQRFEGLAQAKTNAKRELYFIENTRLSQFYIVVKGQAAKLFNPDNPPSIVTKQGSVEEWTIQNRTSEPHEFHIHQIHFLVVSQNHFQINGSEPVPGIDGQFLDTIQVPYWDGNPGHPFPSVTLRMDFRGPDIGDFVYHCHILKHEDKGMMAIIRVKPAGE